MNWLMDLGRAIFGGGNNNQPQAIHVQAPAPNNTPLFIMGGIMAVFMVVILMFKK